MKAFAIGLALSIGAAHTVYATETGPASAYDAVISRHAATNGVPETLVRRIIQRESRYNPKARNGPYMGMMQISATTARSMGYRGAPAGLLDPDVNLTYAVRYLAGAYRTAGGDHDRAVRFYARGYYYDAKRKGLLATIGLGRDGKFKAAPPAGPAATVTQARVAAPAVATIQLATASTALPGPTAPLPPIRGGAPAVTVALASAGPAVPLPRPRDPAASPVATARAVATEAAPAVLASAGPASDPGVTGSIPARGAAPIPPVRPSAPAPLRPRMVSPTTPPALASAGPVMRPSAPEAPALAYASGGRDAAPSVLRGSIAPMPPRR